MKKLLQRRQGFTLIELLIVIVIIGILSVGFAPTLLNAPKKARDGVRKGQIASIQQAIEAYALDNVYLATAADKCLPAAYNVNFQGSVAPVDPSGTTYQNGSCTTKGSFEYGYDAVNKCYYIGATMEIAETNSADSVTNCAPVVGTKKNYYVITKL